MLIDYADMTFEIEKCDRPSDHVLPANSRVAFATKSHQNNISGGSEECGAEGEEELLLWEDGHAQEDRRPDQSLLHGDQSESPNPGLANQAGQGASSGPRHCSKAGG